MKLEYCVKVLGSDDWDSVLEADSLEDAGRLYISAGEVLADEVLVITENKAWGGKKGQFRAGDLVDGLAEGEVCELAQGAVVDDPDDSGVEWVQVSDVRRRSAYDGLRVGISAFAFVLGLVVALLTLIWFLQSLQYHANWVDFGGGVFVVFGIILLERLLQAFLDIADAQLRR